MVLVDILVYVYAALALGYFVVSPGAREEFHAWVKTGWRNFRSKYMK